MGETFLSHKTDCSDSGLGRAQAWIMVVKGYLEEEGNIGQWEVGIVLQHVSSSSLFFQCCPVGAVGRLS